MLPTEQEMEYLCIVDDNGVVQSYQGKRLEFAKHEQERAENILFLLNQLATKKLRLIPLIK